MSAEEVDQTRPEDEVDETPADLMDALKKVLKRSLIADGLAVGLHQGAKALDKREAHLCVLAEDCSEDSYTRLVEALCKQHNIDLVKVPERKKLGEWVGLAKYDASKNVKKVVGCSCCVIKDYGEGSKALEMIQAHIAGGGGVVAGDDEEAEE